MQIIVEFELWNIDSLLNLKAFRKLLQKILQKTQLKIDQLPCLSNVNNFLRLFFNF